MDTFTALAEPRRRALIEALAGGPETVNGLVQTVGWSQPAVSKHLKVLRDAGLVSVRPEGQRRWYAVNPAALQELDRWLEPYRRLWADRLDALGEHLDERHPRRTP